MVNLKTSTVQKYSTSSGCEFPDVKMFLWYLTTKPQPYKLHKDRIFEDLKWYVHSVKQALRNVPANNKKRTSF